MSHLHLNAANDSLRNIVNIAHSISSLSRLHPTTPSSTIPVDFDEKLLLPPPSPIRDSLFSIGLHPLMVAQLSDAFDTFASRLKKSSETRWRLAIHACRQIEVNSHVPSLNSRSLYAAASSAYERALRHMEQWVVSSCRRHLAESRYLSTSASIPRGLSLPRRVAKTLRRPNHLSDDIRTNNSTITSAGNLSVISSFVPTDTMARKTATSDAVWPHKIDGTLSMMQPAPHFLQVTTGDIRASELNQDNFLEDHTVCAYPARYVHPKPSMARNFVFRSEDFFGPSTTNKSSDSELMNTTVDSMLGRLHDLRIRRAGGGKTLRSRSPHGHIVKLETETSLSPSSSSPIRLSPRPTSSQVTLDEPVTLDASQVPRRKLVPLPRRTVPASDRIPMSTSERVLPTSTPCASSTRSSPSVDAISLPLPVNRSLRVSVSEPRRKVAPLPRRQPTAASTHRHNVSLPLTSNVSLSLSCIPAAFPSTALSRTPSLASLTSSRSSSASPSPEGPATPPASPHMRPFVLCSPVDESFDNIYLSEANRVSSRAQILHAELPDVVCST